MFSDLAMYDELKDFGFEYQCVQKLYDTFADACSEDQGKTGIIDRDSLFAHLKIEHNEFTKRLFTFLDTDDRYISYIYSVSPC